MFPWQCLPPHQREGTNKENNNDNEFINDRNINLIIHTLPITRFWEGWSNLNYNRVSIFSRRRRLLYELIRCRTFCNFMKVECRPVIFIESNFSNVITSSIKLYHRLLENLMLFSRRAKFYFECSLHIFMTNILIRFEEVKYYLTGGGIPPTTEVMGFLPQES